MRFDDFRHDFSGYQRLFLYKPMNLLHEGVPILSDFSFEEVSHANSSVFEFTFEISINTIKRLGSLHIYNMYKKEPEKDKYILELNRESFNSYYDCFIFAYTVPFILSYIEKNVPTWKLRSLFSQSDKEKWVHAIEIKKKTSVFCNHYISNRYISIKDLDDYCDAIIKNDKRFLRYISPIRSFILYFDDTENLRSFGMWNLFHSFLNHVLYTYPEKMVSFDDEEIDEFLYLKMTKKEGIDTDYLIHSDQEIDVRNIIMKWKHLLTSQINDETYQKMISK